MLREPVPAFCRGSGGIHAPSFSHSNPAGVSIRNNPETDQLLHTNERGSSMSPAQVLQASHKVRWRAILYQEVNPSHCLVNVLGLITP